VSHIQSIAYVARWSFVLALVNIKIDDAPRPTWVKVILFSVAFLSFAAPLYLGKGSHE